MKRAHLILWLLIAALASWSGSARADRQPSEEAAPTEPVDQPVDPRAAELKRQGDALMFDLRYEEALALYQQSYAIDPNPALLYNQGRAHQARGSFPEALQMLERFDAEAPDNLKERVPNLAELIGQLRDNVTELTIRCNVNGAKVLLHNREIGATPLNCGTMTTKRPPPRRSSRQVCASRSTCRWSSSQPSTRPGGSGPASAPSLPA
jgi:tetratricopeptide (TPR) repeat protein